MTVEVKTEETPVAEVVVPEEESKKLAKEVDAPKPRTVEKSSSYKEESNFLSDLKEFEKKALNELKSKLEEAILGNNLYKKEGPKKSEKPLEEKEKPVKEEKEKEEEEKEAKEEDKETGPSAQEEPEKEEEAKPEGEKNDEEGEKEENPNVGVEGKTEEVDKDISLWGVPLLPSKGFEGTDVVLLKFLRAREFKVNEAFEMLKKTLQWRKDSKIDSILDEELYVDLSSAACVDGVDREGHPVCYNVFGVFDTEELYQKTYGTEEKRSHFLRWRRQLMEKSIQKLD